MKRIFICIPLILFFALLAEAQPSCPDGMIMIPAGQFAMGRAAATGSDWVAEHIVKIDSFYLDAREVSNAQYYEFCKETGHALPEFWNVAMFRCGLDFPDYPVVGVSYYDAIAFARWQGKRLPTEAEWEYAASAGLEKPEYPHGNTIDSTMANYGKKFRGSLPLQSFPCNGFGLFDMAGNVWEWTNDFYKDDYYTLSPDKNPQGPTRGRFRVIRGGSWHSGAMCVRVYFRNGLPGNWVDFAVGFRCAKSLSPL